MSKSSEILASLTSEQQEFLKQKTLSSTMKIKNWIGFLSAIAQLDQLGDEKIKSLKKWIIFCFIMAFICVIFSVATAFASLVLGFVLVILGFILVSKRKKLKKQDVSNYMREFFIPVLHLFKDKAGEETKLSAQLDFRNPREALEPVKSTVMGRKQKSYAPVYIIAKVPLTDGALVEFVVQEEIRDQNWSKTNARGKTKYKSKTKLIHQCTIRITLPKEKYNLQPTPDTNVEITENEQSYLAKTKFKIKKIGDHVLHIRAFIDAMQLIYSQFQPTDGSLAPSEPIRTDRNDADYDYEYDDMGMMAPYIWYGGYFDRYDYDSFDHNHYSGEYYENDGESVFDS